MEKRKRPPGFMIYEETRNMVLFMPDDALGRVVKAAFEYFYDHSDPQAVASLNGPERKIYGQFKKDADRAWNTYENICEANKLRAEKRWEKERGKNNLPS